MTEGDDLKFKDVMLTGKAGRGMFKVTPAQLGWKCMEPGKDDSQVFSASDVASASWRQCLPGGRCMMKICCKGETAKASRFSGFRPEDIAALKVFMEKHYKVSLLEEPAATEGWCWGDVTELPGAKQGDPDFKVMVNGKVGFDFHIGELKQVNTLAKTDLQLEFQETSVLPTEEWLSEIRFVVPGGGPEAITAEHLKEVLQKRTGSTAGEVLARIRDVSIVTPRGKHDFEFFPKSMKIHGKTQTYAFPYSNIRHVFMLEHGTPQRGAVTQMLVLGLNQPLSQGQQAHTHIVLQFHGQTIVVPEELPPERLQSMQLRKGDVQKAHTLMAKVIRELSTLTIIGPSGKFAELNPHKEHCVRCTYKATPGALFFCNKSLLYVTKPVVYLKYPEITHVGFQSGKLQRRSFDLDVHLRSGVSHEFTQIETEMKEVVLRFLSEHTDVQIENKKEVESSLDVARGRAEGRRGTLGKSHTAEVDDGDDDEEEDGDFEGNEESDGSDDSSLQEDFEAEEPKAKRARK